MRHPIALRRCHHARLLARRLLRLAVSTAKNLHYPLRVRDRGVFEGALTRGRKLSPIGRSLGGCEALHLDPKSTGPRRRQSRAL
jgi:hypothetical protein